MTSPDAASEELRCLGVTELTGGLISFTVSAAVLYFVRLKEATHFCNSSILYSFIIAHSAQSICYILKGSTSLAYD